MTATAALLTSASTPTTPITSAWKSAGPRLKGRDPDHPQGERQQSDALQKRRAGSPHQNHAGDPEADYVIRRIPEEAQRSGLQGSRTSRDAASDLGQEHDPIDGEGDPQDAAPRGVAGRWPTRGTRFVIAAARHAS